MQSNSWESHPAQLESGIDRRTLLILGGVGMAGLVAAPIIHRAVRPRATSFVARNQHYDGPLATTIRDGILACDFEPDTIRGKRVLLKPNLVEPCRNRPHMTTHPAMVVAAAEVFASWGADVIVGEAPGHVRDTEMALIESGLGEALNEMNIPFADLNYEEVQWVPNRGKRSTLEGLYLPRSVASADLIVSMPKLKTHHWMGMTASTKNLYGVLPGIQYGWPKNVLHLKGIPQTVVDIAASVPKTLAIIDGIDCMEGDGPILGTKKSMGLVAVGTNTIAADATVARIMGLVPERISYLALAADDLGPINERRIEQRGEAWQPLVDPFAVLDEPHLRSLQATENGPVVS
ncbi:MAG: DUF362 domain-containing protein [Pirellulales bacterium]|nr:DUF362 domain-containing protein [Pirellulales bacterium]